MATSFSINQADLEFILRQIRIAEAHRGRHDLDPSHPERIRPLAQRRGSGALRAAHGRRPQQQFAARSGDFGAADTAVPAAARSRLRE